VLLGLAASVAEAQVTYPQTLYWGAGLIDIPAAWVAPLTGDFALNYSGKSFNKGDPVRTKINYNDRMNSQLTASMSFVGRVEAGVAFFSSNPEYGFFGQGLLLDQEQFRDRSGGARWVPSLALGIRNVGPYKHIDRFGVGYQLVPPKPGSPNYRHIADSVHRDFSTANSVYGVATKDFSLSDIRPTWPTANIGVSLGFGGGLFHNHGDVPKSQYAKAATGGLFGGIKVDFQPARMTGLSLMLENNAWDWNLGASLDYRGIRAGLYWTEMTAGGAEEGTAPGVFYNYSKVAFTLGWQSNLFALLRGNFLRGRVAELERQREGLLAEINTRQQRIQALELEINRLEAQNLLELEQRRAEAERQLQDERESLRRLQERLEQLERRNPPTNPPAPPSRPPRR
jgi:hypothetical protein